MKDCDNDGDGNDDRMGMSEVVTLLAMVPMGKEWIRSVNILSKILFSVFKSPLVVIVTIVILQKGILLLLP